MTRVTFIVDQATDGASYSFDMTEAPARGDLVHVAGSVRRVLHRAWFPPDSAVVITVTRDSAADR